MARTDNPDPTTVDALVSGRRLSGRPRYADKVAACRRLAAAGYTDRQIATFLSLTARSVLRMRATNRIPGQPRGINGYTRRHATPNPVPPQKRA